MCGIVGYIGKGQALPVIIDGLKRLEYRGYDSAGIAYQNGRGIEIIKSKGKIHELEKILPNPFPKAGVGLGHTRWATHGAPSERNAHPHRAEGLVVVHNGIIENHRELRLSLIESGHHFSSDTDTEVIPHLILSHLKRGQPLKEAIYAAVSRLKGSFALGIMSEHHPGSLYAVRKGSPLVVGIGDGQFFFASDTPALLHHTNKFIFLEDDHMCILGKDSIDIEEITSGKSIPLQDNIRVVDWAPSMAEKEGYDHFMLKEVFEQPRAVKDTLREWIDDPKRSLEHMGLDFETLGLRRLHIVACGTSYHAALVGRYLIESLARIPVDVDIASEYRYRKPIVEKGSVFMSITQSGETADTLAAQREAKTRGARTLTICNVVGSTSARENDAVFYTHAGPEIGVASTKAFTSQMAALSILAVALAMGRGGLTADEVSQIRSHFLKMPRLIEKALESNDDIRELAKSICNARNALFLGRGINFPIALEGALKLKEISYIHAEGYPAGEMKHGPIALIEQGLPVVVLAPADELFEKILSNMEEVKARGGKIIAVTDKPELLSDKVDHIIPVPQAPWFLSPFINVIPLQLLAYHVAVLKGCDVDQPRNLAKSVTVE